MTREEKDLLLKDLSGRLPYGLKVCYITLSDEMPKVWDLIGMPSPHLADIIVEGKYRFAACDIEENIRPYLRPITSMTEKEIKELSAIDMKRLIFSSRHLTWPIDGEVIDYLNRKMFDWRHLISKGLAIEAPEDMYKTDL